MNIHYKRLSVGFGEWLRILNFEQGSQRDMPRMLNGFLDFLTAGNCNSISGITERHIQDYLGCLRERPGRGAEGTLSLNYLRKQLQVIKKFARYLAESGQDSFEVKIRLKGKGPEVKTVLTRDEITKLYAAVKEDVLGLRDRAILALYYGCGLRKNEGLAMHVEDILLEKELIYVRKGKGYKERLVPLTGRHKADIENYMSYSRPYLLNGTKERALLLTVRGSRLKTVFERIQKLKKDAGISRAAGLHTFRHSIATHLLESGMKLEYIQRFLGHSSLESTQIYTHIQAENGKTKA
jgi:integrase/recombinase XerD